MGIYVNPDNSSFAMDRTDDIYVDKSGLIRLTNKALGTQNRRIVVSRPRRFGKTMSISMLEAYYSSSCNSRELFRGLAIESDPSFEEHLNKHHVISVDVQGLRDFAESKKRLDDFPEYFSETVNLELGKLYPDEVRGNESSLAESILSINDAHDVRFIFLIDEWDVIYREDGFNTRLFCMQVINILKKLVFWDTFGEPIGG